MVARARRRVGGALLPLVLVDCEAACDGSGSGEVISVRSVGGFGSVEIVTESEKAAEEDGLPPLPGADD